MTPESDYMILEICHCPWSIRVMSTVAARSKQVSGKLAMRNSKRDISLLLLYFLWSMPYTFLWCFSFLCTFKTGRSHCHPAVLTVSTCSVDRVGLPLLCRQRNRDSENEVICLKSLVVAELGLEDSLPALEFVVLYFYVSFSKRKLTCHPPMVLILLGTEADKLF